MAAGQQAHSAHATALSKSREEVHEVDEPGLSSSADGKGKQGIDRSFEWTGIPKYLSE